MYFFKNLINFSSNKLYNLHQLKLICDIITNLNKFKKYVIELEGYINDIYPIILTYLQEFYLELKKKFNNKISYILSNNETNSTINSIYDIELDIMFEDIELYINCINYLLKLISELTLESNYVYITMESNIFVEFVNDFISLFNNNVNKSLNHDMSTYSVFYLIYLNINYERDVHLFNTLSKEIIYSLLKIVNNCVGEEDEEKSCVYKWKIISNLDRILVDIIRNNLDKFKNNKSIINKEDKTILSTNCLLLFNYCIINNYEYFEKIIFGYKFIELLILFDEYFIADYKLYDNIIYILKVITSIIIEKTNNNSLNINIEKILISYNYSLKSIIYYFNYLLNTGIKDVYIEINFFNLIISMINTALDFDIFNNQINKNKNINIQMDTYNENSYINSINLINNLEINNVNEIIDKYIYKSNINEEVNNLVLNYINKIKLIKKKAI